jgi:Lon protease-like protein
VGCTAEIRQISRQDDGMLNIVAKGTPDCNVAIQAQALSQSSKATLTQVCSTTDR